jgi:radical SAM superfamily enzyme YgiQ (UPF0313 family)
MAGVYLGLVKKGLDVRCIDQLSGLEENLSARPEENSADICCYAVFYGNKVSAFRHMEAVRRAPQAPRHIIVFGPFASVFSEEILLRGLADIVVSNDPEFVIPAVLQKGEVTSILEGIPNLSYIHQGKIIHTQKHSFHDLDEIPFVSPYLYSKGHRPALILTARGCQYHCVFCDRNVLWGGGVRNRSVDNVLSEIRELTETHQVKEIKFLDEDLAADHKRLIAICEGIRHIKKEFYWTCSACVDSVSKKTLLLMGRSRCRRINFGVESASPQVLRRIGKTYGREDIFNAVRWSREAGLKVAAMITIGNPGETDLDRDLTLSALRELGSEITVTPNRLVVLPGTAFYRKGLREGWFTQKSFFEDEGIVFYDEKCNDQ